ncbi:hypothetical protein RQP46_002137 [Phenoliferia psychrophenolica]
MWLAKYPGFLAIPFLVIGVAVFSCGVYFALLDVPELYQYITRYRQQKKRDRVADRVLEVAESARGGGTPVRSKKLATVVHETEAFRIGARSPVVPTRGVTWDASADDLQLGILQSWFDDPLCPSGPVTGKSRWFELRGCELLLGTDGVLVALMIRSYHTGGGISEFHVRKLRSSNRDVMYTYRMRRYNVTEAKRKWLPFVTHWLFFVHLIMWSIVFAVSFGADRPFTQANCSKTFNFSWFRTFFAISVAIFIVVASLFWGLFGLGLRSKSEIQIRVAGQSTTYLTREDALSYVSKVFIIDAGWIRHKKRIRIGVGFLLYSVWAGFFVGFYIESLQKFLLLGDDPLDFGQLNALMVRSP